MQGVLIFASFLCVFVVVWLVGWFWFSTLRDSPAANKLSSTSGPLLLLFDLFLIHFDWIHSFTGGEFRDYEVMCVFELRL